MQLLSLSRLKRRGMLGGALLTIAVGTVLITWTIGDGFALRSYDLPFLWRSEVKVPEIIIVYLDGKTQDLYSREGGAWARRLYARLLDRLREEQASLVIFDMLFDREKDPEVDRSLADTIRRHGNVVIGSVAEGSPHQTGAGASADLLTVKLPLPMFREAARATGLIAVGQEPIQRRLYPGTAEHPAINWVAAALATTNTALSSSRRLEERWLNYYGPAYSLKSVSLSDAVEADGTPPGFFRGRTVFVGGHPSVFLTEGFITPFSRIMRFSGSRSERSSSAGVEILATGFANLVRDESIFRMRWSWQLGLVVLWGGLAGAGLLLLRPWHAAWVALLAALPLTFLSFQLQWQAYLTWAWLVPVAVQTPLALVWSVGYQYAVEGRQRRQLIRAFGAYLSPHVVQRIAESKFDVAPGGQEVEATILFTDLEGFTAMAEKLPPGEVSQILIAYFNETTRHIWTHEGTIIKYIGDSVMAAWGAPLPEARHAERAVLAACGMIEAGRKEILGRRLRTRIGINTGRALAGNLGSKFRFDYTVIGATTNLASRLEGMNQRLGTNILISESTRVQLSDRVRVRRLGRFLVKGITQPFRAYEVLDTPPQPSGESDWVTAFEQGIAALECRAWSECERLFGQTKELRGGKDGPSEFYLELLASLRARATESEFDWDGIARL